MLNNDAISQLSQLKKDIQASKEYGSGTVVGSNGRFGFVRLDDGRDAFLSPDKMQRVIPGDIVHVSLKKNDKDKLEADLEKLLTPALDRFIGRYRVKGNAHFVEPSGIQSSRWIFLPPKSRSKCKEGDYVVAKMLQHPFREGKPSAKIVERVGRDDEARFELKYTKAKYNLNQPEDKAQNNQTKAVEKQFSDLDLDNRSDLSHLPFVTIDAANTKDMDDAIAIEYVEREGHNVSLLHVAIADPSSFIPQNSPLANASLKNGKTVYLPGGLVPMFPIQLSHHCFSLEPQKKRPALVCHIEFNQDGEVLSSNFEFAYVESKHKLSYEDVGAFIESDQDSVPEECKVMLKQLHDLSLIRRQYRERHFLVVQDQIDYDYQFDEQGHIQEIKARPRNAGHQIVEEAMLATNICGAELLSQHNTGLFVVHPGFRPDRLGEVKALLKEENIVHDDLNTLEEQVKLFSTLDSKGEAPNLSLALRRMMVSSELSATKAPHLGMGLPIYSTLTSPIRRFADLYNHWCLQHIIHQKSVKKLSERDLEKLSETLQNGKQADRELYQWLLLEYTKKQIGQQARGTIRIVTQHGFGVKLDDNGIEGFILFGKDKEKKYDAKRMTLTVDKELYYLGKSVEIKIKSVDQTKRRIAFELVVKKQETVVDETVSA